jgi:hypothetical protein
VHLIFQTLASARTQGKVMLAQERRATKREINVFLTRHPTKKDCNKRKGGGLTLFVKIILLFTICPATLKKKGRDREQKEKKKRNKFEVLTMFMGGTHILCGLDTLQINWSVHFHLIICLSIFVIISH